MDSRSLLQTEQRLRGVTVESLSAAVCVAHQHGDVISSPEHTLWTIDFSQQLHQTFSTQTPKMYSNVDEYEIEAAREAQRRLQQQQAEEQQYRAMQHHNNNSAHNLPSSPRTHTLTSMAPPFESHSDPDNPIVLSILQMARRLGIDATSEFYLLPIAMHALDSSQESQRDAGAGAQAQQQAQMRPDIEWFQQLVLTERARFRKTPSENSPWLKIKDTPATAASSSNGAQSAAAGSSTQAANASAASSAAPTSFWYNFKTFRRSSTLPPPKSSSTVLSSTHGRSSSDRHQELTVMKFTSWYTEASVSGPEKKRYVKIWYHLAADEFEIHLVNSDPHANTPEQRDQTQSKIFRVKSLKTKQGTQASCWDLHIKATLDIFGRPTTLRQCESVHTREQHRDCCCACTHPHLTDHDLLCLSLSVSSDTRTWLETNASRLLQVRSMLEAKLTKFENISEKRRANVPLVEQHLRALMKDVARLKNALAAYRPSLAEKLAL